MNVGLIIAIFNTFTNSPLNFRMLLVLAAAYQAGLRRDYSDSKKRKWIINHIFSFMRNDET